MAGRGAPSVGPPAAGRRRRPTRLALGLAEADGPVCSSAPTGDAAHPASSGAARTAATTTTQVAVRRQASAPAASPRSRGMRSGYGAGRSAQERLHPDLHLHRVLPGSGRQAPARRCAGPSSRTRGTAPARRDPRALVRRGQRRGDRAGPAGASPAARPRARQPSAIRSASIRASWASRSASGPITMARRTSLHARSNGSSRFQLCSPWSQPDRPKIRSPGSPGGSATSACGPIPGSTASASASCRSASASAAPSSRAATTSGSSCCGLLKSNTSSQPPLSWAATLAPTNSTPSATTASAAPAHPNARRRDQAMRAG